MKTKLDIDDVRYKERVKHLIASCKDVSKEMLLVGADMSGIQSYLYQIISKDALKNLKGRSFFLRILPDAVVRYLLQETEYDRSHILYNSGGCFYLLLPKTEATLTKLSLLYKEIENRLFAYFHNALYIAFASVSVSVEELNNETTLKEKWDELFQKRDAQKNARYASLLKDNYARWFEPSSVGGAYKIDAMTGEEIIGRAVSTGDKFVSERTNEQILLGEVLKKAVGMLVTKETFEHLGNPYEPLGLGFHYYILDADKFKLCQAHGYGTLYEFNKETSDDVFFFSGGKDNTESLSKLVDSGLNKLGVVRMDVDNLGYIFQNSGKGADVPFAKTIALSRQLDGFFSGYINELLEDGFKKNVSIVYSGGDDVFFVGDWSDCIEFAEAIRKAFSEFVSDAPQYNISGGISIVKDKFPLLKAAEMSGEEEYNAKHHTCGVLEKNAFSLLGYALNWEHEYKQVKELKDELVGLRNANMLDAAFLQYIMQMAAEAGITYHEIKNYKVYWLLAYGLHRLCDRNKNAQSFADNLLIDLKERTLNGKRIQTDYHPLELWALACRWAEFETR